MIPIARAPAWLDSFHRRLRQHPETAFAEHRTAALVAEALDSIGLAVRTGVGGTGVVGVLRNGPGATVVVRSELDALPSSELRDGGAVSRADSGCGPATDRSGPAAAVHSCGHDLHTACLVGVAADLAARRSEWRGTVVFLAQPAEETGQGARAMIEDGALAGLDVDVILGQHVTNLPLGVVGLAAGPSRWAGFQARIVFRGGDGHTGAAAVGPTSDALLVAARAVVELSRPPADTSVTVGRMTAGVAANVLAADAVLDISARARDGAGSRELLGWVGEVVQRSAADGGLARRPVLDVTGWFPEVVNDRLAAARVSAALVGAGLTVVDPGPISVNDDFSEFGLACGAPSVNWLLGCVGSPALAAAGSPAAVPALLQSLPTPHAEGFSPDSRGVLATGVAALRAAALGWLRHAPAREQDTGPDGGTDVPAASPPLGATQSRSSR